MPNLRLFAFSMLALTPSLAHSADEKWGNLTGHFFDDGAAPPVETLRVTKDRAAFGDSIEDESLMVNRKNRGIANIVVYLLSKNVPVHPSYARTANSKVEFTVQGGQFVPHILLLRTTQTMSLCNEDPIGHNPNFHFFRNASLGALLTANTPIKIRYVEETYPIQVGCNVHPWMRAYVLPRSNPYMAKTDTDGKFVIKHLPVGEHVFRLWHERTGLLRNMRIGSRKTDSKGRLTITIRTGKNELPPCELAAKIFARDD